jgi:uncharacterized membrane protein YqgA involved in biofilm formation
MEWSQAIAIIVSNIGLVLVMFGATIGIWLHTDKKIEAIQQEIKDFHGRLCTIEERKKDHRR